MNKVRVGIGFLMLLCCCMITRVWAAELIVTLNNTENGKGKVYVALCMEETFMKGRCAYEVARAARSKATSVSFTSVPAGIYAISAFYDLDDDEELDTNFIGVPKEPTAASNNAVGRNGPPEFTDAKFTLVDSQESHIEIDLY